MSVCDYCKEEMTIAHSCVRVPIIHEKKEYEPIKFGDEDMSDFELFLQKRFGEAKRCGDCGVEKGGYHHPGCDIEKCPVCGLQLISCDCIDEN